jgi:hypothetical protein
LVDLRELGRCAEILGMALVDDGVIFDAELFKKPEDALGL